MILLDSIGRRLVVLWGENIKTVKDRPYTKEEISKLIDTAQDMRLKIAILLMCGSGLRIGSISVLKIRNLEWISKYGIYQITVYEKTKQEYITFCTPECASVINSYLEYRKRNGDRLKPSEPLLKDEFDINDPIRAASQKTLIQHLVFLPVFSDCSYRVV